MTVMTGPYNKRSYDNKVIVSANTYTLIGIGQISSGTIKVPCCALLRNLLYHIVTSAHAHYLRESTKLVNL
jgi:hypothetical protein